MRILVFTFLAILMMAVPAFSQVDIQGPHHTLGIGSNAQAGASAINAPVNNFNPVNAPVNNFNPTNIDIQKQGQSQGQFQGQIQGQNNNQIIAPKQSMGLYQVVAPEQNVVFESPTQLLATPNQEIPPINFGNGKLTDVTKNLPNFALYGIKPLGSESIAIVLSVTANVKFKKLYQTVLDDAKEIYNGGNKTLTNVRYQIIRAEAQKTWHSGGNIGGGGSAVGGTGALGGSGAASIVPSWGGTKADDLFTIIFVSVLP